ncbi:MAG: amidohydrolase, partial [Candidatus Kapabacteria bacterium]|nr:amidohydrolase [Candidatus Kapabacteria bacterium]
MTTPRRRAALRLLTLCTIALCTAPAFAHNEIPGAKQEKPVALTNAKIYTVAAGIIERGTVVFDKGKIISVGATAAIPAGADVIDCAGKSVYPGFIAPSTTLGLTEIDAVRATRDMAESGVWNPNACGAVAYNPDSEIIPTVRINGVLIANVMPQGGVVSGTSSLMMMDGWTREDIALRQRAALVVNIPNLAVFSAPWMQKSPDEQRKDGEKRLQELYGYFEKAQMYSRAARQGLADGRKDIRLEAMRPVFESQLPVILNCSEYKQILAAIEFAKKFNLRAILNGADDAWRLTAEIKASGFPVIVERVHGLPRREDEGYDQTYQLPRILAEAGIVFAFSDNGSWQQRNLPFMAGSAMAFGLKEEDAVRALT